MEGDQWDTVAALVDPVRRALFDHVRRQEHAVTREQAADAVGVSRNLSAFHLDKLVLAGLLRARYESTPGEHRGRGRTPKVYEPSDSGLALTVPPRQYELMGDILASAIAEEPADAQIAARRRAVEVGRDIGKAGRVRRGTDVAGELARAYAALDDLGFEPRSTGAEQFALGNCPFHALALRQRELICGLNLSLIGGMLAGLGTSTLDAKLNPRPGACCVEVTRS